MDEKIRQKNMFPTDKLAGKAFCVGGIFYPIRFLYYIREHQRKIEYGLSMGVSNGIIG